MNDDLAYVAVDCGVGAVRAWLLDVDGNVLSTAETDCDIDGNSKQALEDMLAKFIGESLPEGRVTPVICSGFGCLDWPETCFENVPCKTPDQSLLHQVASNDPRIALWLVPSVKQSGPDDVMGLEAVQLAGFLAQNPKFDGVACLPGAHSQWVRISAEEIVSFQTYLTGEMIDVLSRQSVVRRAVDTKEIDKKVFLDAVSEALSRPQSVAAKLFGLRASHLLSDQSLIYGNSCLLGQLVGTELAGSRPYWLGMDIAVIGTLENCALYSEALSAQGCMPKVYDGEAMTLAGMQLLFEGLETA